MKRLKKTTVPCIRNFIKTVTSNSSKSEQAALLNDVIKIWMCCERRWRSWMLFRSFPSKCSAVWHSNRLSHDIGSSQALHRRWSVPWFRGHRWLSQKVKRKKILKDRDTYSPSSIPAPNPVDMLFNTLRLNTSRRGRSGNPPLNKSLRNSNAWLPNGRKHNEFRKSHR